MRVWQRRSEWADDMAQVVQLYLRDRDVQLWVDVASSTPDVAFHWSNRSLPVSVLEAAGEIGHLLVARDPIVLQSVSGFQRKTTYTYYPAPFLLEYVNEILEGAKRAG